MPAGTIRVRIRVRPGASRTAVGGVTSRDKIVAVSGVPGELDGRLALLLDR